MTRFFLRTRANETELLDEKNHDLDQLRLNLEHLAGVNRWLGGERSVMTHLRSHVRNAVDTFRLLDVGSGGGDLPCHISHYVSRQALDSTILALDVQRPVTEVATERSSGVAPVRFLVGDGLALPVPDKSVDVAISSTTLHHLSTTDAVFFVNEMSRVARKRVIVSDLDRNEFALLGAHVLARTWWRRSHYRFDGPISVRKAFTKSELLAVGNQAGLQQARVHRHFPFRLTLVGIPPA